MFAGERGEVLRFEHINSGFHIAIAQSQHAVTPHQFGIAGQGAAAVQDLLRGKRPQRPRHQCGKRRAQGPRLAFTVGMHTVGKDDTYVLVTG